MLPAYDRCPARGRRGLGPRALGNREPTSLGQRRHLRRGPPPATHRQRPRDHGRAMQPGHPASSDSSTAPAPPSPQPPDPCHDNPNKPSNYSPKPPPKPTLPPPCPAHRHRPKLQKRRGSGSFLKFWSKCAAAPRLQGPSGRAVRGRAVGPSGTERSAFGDSPDFAESRSSVTLP